MFLNFIKTNPFNSIDNVRITFQLRGVAFELPFYVGRQCSNAMSDLLASAMFNVRMMRCAPKLFSLTKLILGMSQQNF